MSPEFKRNKPIYIHDKCERCNSELALWDEVNKCFDTVPGFEEEFETKTWYDEWCCPKCNDLLYLDYPKTTFGDL